MKNTYKQQILQKIDSTSKVFFLEESEYQIPEILFGDGVVGKALNNGDVVNVTYTTSAGRGANGLKVFENIGTYRDNLGNAITTGINVSMTTDPDGGAEPETTESIKFVQNSILRSVEQFLLKIMKQLSRKSIQTSRQ